MIDTLVHPWMVHPHTGEPLRAVWVRPNGRPVWPIMGASEDDVDEDEDDADEDESDADEDEDGDDPDKDKSPEEIKAELQRLRASRRKDIKRIRRMREKAKEAGKKPADEDPDKKFSRAELEEIRTETETATRGEMLPVVIKHAATSALREAGFAFPADRDERAKKLNRALKLMDVEDVEIDDDGELLGLQDAIEELKAEWPELFRKADGARQRKRPGNVGGTGKPVTRKKSVTELQAEALFPGRG
jgi:hypothetical protein